MQKYKKLLRLERNVGFFCGFRCNLGYFLWNLWWERGGWHLWRGPFYGDEICVFVTFFLRFCGIMCNFAF